MLFKQRKKVRIETERMILRPPVMSDYRQWADLRRESRDFLVQWEPTWSTDHLTRKAFSNRVYWAQRSVTADTALPMFMERREDGAIVGAITLDNIRRGPAQAGTMGYWIGAPYARHGYMREAIDALVHYAFAVLDISRVEAACLEKNVPSRGVLEKSGFKFEGVSQSYLQINGRWRTHVLYSCLRSDRRGKTDAG